MSGDRTETLTLRVGSHAFKIRCEASESESMRAAAEVVNREYINLRERERVADGERAAIMVALQLASGRMDIKAQSDGSIGAVLDDCLELAASRPDS